MITLFLFVVLIKKLCCFYAMLLQLATSLMYDGNVIWCNWFWTMIFFLLLYTPSYFRDIKYKYKYKYIVLFDINRSNFEYIWMYVIKFEYICHRWRSMRLTFYTCCVTYTIIILWTCIYYFDLRESDQLTTLHLW